jgi:lysine 2,3-aminomutase
MEGLRGHTSGYAVPTFVVDTMGGGKVPVSNSYVVGREGHDVLLRNFENRVFRYADVDV